MNRRNFLTHAGLLSYGAHFSANHLLAIDQVASDAKVLKGHRIDKVEFLSANYHFPNLRLPDPYITSRMNLSCTDRLVLIVSFGRQNGESGSLRIGIQPCQFGGP